MSEGRYNLQESMDIEHNSHAVLNSDGDFEDPLLPIAVPSDGDSDDRGHGEPMYRDKSWAIAFKINVLLTVFSAVWFGTMGFEALMADSLTNAGRRRLHLGHSGHHDGDSYGHPMWSIILAMTVCAAIACFVTFGVLHSLFHCGRGLIMTSYVFFGLIWIPVTVVAYIEKPVFAILPAVICVVVLRFVTGRKRRITFAGANLKVACTALKALPWIFSSTVLMGVVQFLWSVVAAIAALGSFVALESVTAPDGSSYRAIDCLAALNARGTSAGESIGSSCFCNGEEISDGQCNFSGFGLPLMVIGLLSMAWGCAVIRNVVACTTSGAVASWWFTPGEDAAPVKGAFHRATRSSFGSLCKAAVVQKAITVVTVIAHRVLRFIPCALGLLRWVDIAVKYALAYTVAFIGIYGLDFKQARARVRELFEKRGVTTLANDVTLEVSCTFVAISAVVLYALVSSVALGPFLTSEPGMDSVEFWSFFGPQIFGLCGCIFLIMTVLELARSGYKAVFVCFVQDPEVLTQKHDPEVHEHLSAAWTDLQNENSTVVGAPVGAN